MQVKIDPTYKQAVVTGTLVLKEDVLFRNTRNDGLESWSPFWDSPANIIVPAGTEVVYLGTDTRVGFYHEVSVTRDGKRFACTKLGNTIQCECKSTYRIDAKCGVCGKSV